jgi:hypothetical protein
MLYHVYSPTHIECHTKSATIKRIRHYRIFDSKPEQSDIPVKEVVHLIPADVINSTDMQPNKLKVSVGKKPAKNSTKQVWDNIGSYRKALPPERQRLLAWSTPTFPYTTADIPKLLSWLCKAPTMECGSDGSLKDKTGTFGYVLSINGNLVWEGAGPADGDHLTANSKRPELYGYAGCLETCLLILKVGKVMGATLPESLTIRIWVDNSSALRHLNKLLSRKKTQNRYPQDPDILSHIQWLWSQLPAGPTYKARWVKAHQDDQMPFDDLPLNAKLNVVADQLATQYNDALWLDEHRATTN